MNIIYLPLDQKINADSYKTVRIFEEVTLGTLQGYRFKGLKSSVTCIEGGMLSGFTKKTNPEGIITAGNDVLFILKHPKDPSIILVINASSEDKESTEAKLNTKAALFEKFLSALNFN